MLQAEMPFGSWRESELDTYAKIAKGHFAIPQSVSPEAVDLINQVSIIKAYFFPFPFVCIKEVKHQTTIVLDQKVTRNESPSIKWNTRWFIAVATPWDRLTL